MKLIESYKFYKQYHNNYINKGLHIICIPLLAWSLLAIIKKYRKSNFIPNTIYYLYIFYYIKLHYVYGIYAAIFYKIILNNALQTSYSVKSLTKIHISSWILQFIGHYIEGKRPALIDGLFQSITIAPLFTVIEIITLFFHRSVGNL